jgi:hypothetical protein
MLWSFVAQEQYSFVVEAYSGGRVVVPRIHRHAHWEGY